MRRHQIAVCLISLLTAVSACEDDNTSSLSALGMPGEMFISSHCLIGGQYEALDEAACETAGGVYSRTVYAANMRTASLALIPFYPRKSTFEVIDTTQSVPGATSISTGERPHSLAGDDKGAFVVLVSTIHNDISIVSQLESREIAWQKADKTPRKIIYRAQEGGYFVFFSDGTIRKLTIDYDCGKGSRILTESCKLRKDDLDITWRESGKLDGRLAGYVDHPTQKNIGYASYSDRRYISVVGFDEEAGSCLDGSTTYPCELRRIGAGFGCSDGIDNNGDGLIDAQDPSCWYPWSSEGASTPEDIQVGWYGVGECNDGIDNNGNGLIDAHDLGCVSSNDASEAPGFQPMTAGTCADGIDNDGDGNADRDDAKCLWPTDDESAESGVLVETSGVCRESKSLACYGKNWWSEVETTSTGRGAISIDPKGRWLYVLDPGDSQLIVVDLETEKTIDRSGWYPRHRVVGLPVGRLALDVVGDIRTQQVYKKNSHTVSAERAIAFVSSTNGSVTEYLIHQKLTHYEDGAERESFEELAMRPSDDDAKESYVGTVRCVGRICTETDLPTITLRQRPAILYYTSIQALSDTDPNTGLPSTAVYDPIIQSETWRLEYEGVLEKTERTDGYFDVDGNFHSLMDFCLLGARKGDRLVLNSRSGLKNTEACRAKFGNANFEWSVVSVGPHVLSLAPTGNPADATEIPTEECFSTGLNYEIRANHAWIVTSKSTYVNRRLVAGNTCVDDPRQMYGKTRFEYNQTLADPARVDAQTAIFGIRMPENAINLKRGDAFEFTTRSGLSNVSVGVGAAPTALALFKTSRVNFLLISEASADTVVIYDIDDESIDDTL